MKEQELNKKIVDIINQWHMFQRQDSHGNTIWLENDAEKLAKSLVSAGIGDISEWKYRVEFTEKALDMATELAYEYRTEADTLSCSSCPMFHIFDSCKERGLYRDCAKRWKEELLRQAKEES